MDNLENEMITKNTNRSRRKEIRETVELLRKHIQIRDSWQEKPNTFVVMSVYVPFEDKVYSTFGFSKVAYPDKWDKEYGLELATTKALYRLAKQLNKARKLV